MRGISSAVLSLTAMALSSLTTYLTFFDARYTLTQAVATVSVQVQSGGSSSGGVASAYYRYFLTPQIILSNRGTRPLVLSNVELVPSSNVERCAPDEDAETPPMRRLDAVIVEPGTVQQLALDVELPAISAEAKPGRDFDLPESDALWCLKWTIFDPNGERREPVTPAFRAKLTFAPPEPDDRYPDAEIDLDYPKEPTRLVSRGWF